MSTPIGHGLAGYAFALIAKKPVERTHLLESALCVFMAIAPDLDIIPGLLVDRAIYFHRGLSHSIGLAFIISALIALIWRFFRPNPLRIFFLCFAAYSSHLVMDFFGQDGRAPFGIQILWPFSSDFFIAPNPIFLGVRHTSSVDASGLELIRGLLDPANLRSLLIEILVVLPALVAGWIWQLKNSRRGGFGKRTSEQLAQNSEG